MLLSPGTRVGPYEILEQIGVGGMFDVYTARDTRLSRTVALKICSDQFGHRFQTEARSVAELSHRISAPFTTSARTTS
jgi:eukaryotic-like serine/threonine-protein kinase